MNGISQMLFFLKKLYNYNNGDENKLYVLYSDFENLELDNVFIGNW